MLREMRRWWLQSDDDDDYKKNIKWTFCNTGWLVR